VFSLAIQAFLARLILDMKRHSYTSFLRGSTWGLAVALLWLMPAGANAQSAGDSGWFDDSETYAVCLGAIEDDALQAFDRAIAWRDQGGGPPALHCSVLALMELAQYGDAADRLDRLAQDVNNGLAPPLRARLLVQAANAWMLEGYPDQAIESLDAALSIGVEDDGLAAQTYFDRARASFMLGDSQTAINDLTRALRYAPGAKDALTLRSIAYRLLGDADRAMADLDLVLDDDPDYSPALLERGALYRDAGDTDLARADWIRVLQLESEGEILAAAQAYIQALDFPDGP
jgi:tetratricopeptide (TPR) repeat protein